MTTKTADTKSVRAHVHWGMKIMAGLGVVMFALLLWGTVAQGAFQASLMTLVFTLMAGYVFLAADSKIDADEQGLQITAPRGVFRLAWSEIRSVDFKGPAAYFIGDGKALMYNLLLAGKGKRELRAFVAQAIERHHIPIGRPAGMSDAMVQALVNNSRIRGWKLF